MKNIVGISHWELFKKINNGEISYRRWLVYCEYVDKLYCFCCKLFKSSTSSNLNFLAGEDLNDWKHISQRLKKHESSAKHMTNMNTLDEFVEAKSLN